MAPGDAPYGTRPQGEGDEVSAIKFDERGATGIHSLAGVNNQPNTPFTFLPHFTTGATSPEVP
jgi:hypothetical protein